MRAIDPPAPTVALPREPFRQSPWLAAVAVAIIAWIVTSVPRASLIASVTIPDGIEYAAGAQRLATLGRFDLPIGDRTFPSRYPPSFACLLAPAYGIWPTDFYAGFYACRLFWAAGCGALAFALAHRVGATAATFVVTRSTIGRAVAWLAIVAVSYVALMTPVVLPAPRQVGEVLMQLHDALPQRCRLLTIIDPLTCEAFVTHGTRREWIPAQRDQEYADNVVADRRLDLRGIALSSNVVDVAPQLIA